jgi:hypothetical protein
VRSILSAAILGFLGLSSAVAGPMSLSPDWWTLPVGNGGGFDAVLDGDAHIAIYCVDYRNHVNLPDHFMVNASTLDDLSDTRYGTTVQAAFSLQAAPGGTNLGDAGNRYLLAGWLITQYDSNWQGSRDIGIQNAIWSMLDVAGANHTAGDESTWLQNATFWESHATSEQIATMASEITILTSNSVAHLTGDNRYSNGKQEMITIGQPKELVPLAQITETPEPSSAILLGTILLGVALVWRRRVGPAPDLS